jgi:transcriptional regulator with XRE-family HTH domain
VSSAVEGRAGLAEELRRRRSALGWTLEQVAAQAQVSVGMLSLIETGKRRPSLRSWERIRGALGITEPLPEEAWRQRPREISDELVAALGACLAAVRAATLAELAEGTGAPIANVRLALRRLAEQLEATGMQVLDDGSHVQLAPEQRFHSAVAHLRQPETLPRLTQEQAEVLAIVISDGMATRRRIEEVRGATQLSIGPEGPVSVPRDSSGDAGPAALSRPALRGERRSCRGAPPGLRAHSAPAPVAQGGNARGSAAGDAACRKLSLSGATKLTGDRCAKRKGQLEWRLNFRPSAQSQLVCSLPCQGPAPSAASCLESFQASSRTSLSSNGVPNSSIGRPTVRLSRRSGSSAWYTSSGAVPVAWSVFEKSNGARPPGRHRRSPLRSVPRISDDRRRTPSLRPR